MPSSALCLPQTAPVFRLSCQCNGRPLSALRPVRTGSLATVRYPLLVKPLKGQMLMCPLSHPWSKEKHRSTFVCLLYLRAFRSCPQHSKQYSRPCFSGTIDFVEMLIMARH